MRGAIKDSIKWQRAIILMTMNPNVPRVRIGREVGYTGQMIGVIAKAIGLPPGKAGGFQKADNEPLEYPSWWFKAPESLTEDDRNSIKEILENACKDINTVNSKRKNVDLDAKNRKADVDPNNFSWKRPLWMEGKAEYTETEAE